MIKELMQRLKVAVQGELPGKKAQALMLPSVEKKGRFNLRNLENPKKGAVLILLYPEKEEVFTVLMKRPEYSGVHSGQVSFPGGKYEAGDGTLEQTALREAQEEIGIPPAAVSIIGQLTDLYIPASNFLVSPFLGYTEKKPVFFPDKREVRAVITTNVNTFCDDTVKKAKTIKAGNGFLLNAPHYDIQGEVVWGATAMIISELEAILRADMETR